MFEPTFGMYEIYSKIFQANVKTITYDDNLNLDYKNSYNRLIKTLFVIFANPNSPTGIIIEKKDVLSIIKKQKNITAML